jgi:hypothetical protein
MHQVSTVVYAHVAVDEVQKPVKRAISATKVSFQLMD